MSAGDASGGALGARLTGLMRDATDRYRRWRLRAEAAELVRTPYGEPPFPLTYDQWEELCRHEEARVSKA